MIIRLAHAAGVAAAVALTACSAVAQKAAPPQPIFSEIRRRFSGRIPGFRQMGDLQPPRPCGACPAHRSVSDPSAARRSGGSPSRPAMRLTAQARQR